MASMRADEQQDSRTQLCEFERSSVTYCTLSIVNLLVGQRYRILLFQTSHAQRSFLPCILTQLNKFSSTVHAGVPIFLFYAFLVYFFKYG